MEGADGTQLCPPINSSMLKPFSQRINRCLMNIVDKGDVVMQMMGKGQSGKAESQEVTKELISISSDGMRIHVYQNAEGVHSFGGVPLSGAYKEFIYPRMSSRLWKKYLHAYKFVEVVKSKTPKIILLTDKAKCKLMENIPEPDFEAHFHEGTRILLSKAKIQVTEEHGGSMTLNDGCLTDRVSQRTLQMIDYTRQCHSECQRIHESLNAIQARDNLINVFPVMIGTAHSPFHISQQSSDEPGSYCDYSAKSSQDVNCVYQTTGQHNNFASRSPIDTKHQDIYQHSSQNLDESSLSQGFSSVSTNQFMIHHAQASESHSLQATQSTNSSSCSCASSARESQSIHYNAPLFPSAQTETTNQACCEIGLEDKPSNSQWPSDHGHYQNVWFNTDRMNNMAGTGINSFSQNSSLVHQESYGEPSLTEMDASSHIDSSVPFSLSCQSENIPNYPRRLSGQELRTPTKCQSRNHEAFKQFYSEGCKKVKSYMTSDVVEMKNQSQTQCVKRNLFAKNVSDSLRAPDVLNENSQAFQQEFQGAKYPDLLDSSCFNEDQKMNTSQRNSSINVQKQNFSSQQLQDRFSNDICRQNKQQQNQHSSQNSEVSLGTSEMEQLIQNLEKFEKISETPQSYCSTDSGADVSVNSAQLCLTPSSPQRQCLIRKEVLSSNDCLISNISTLSKSSPDSLFSNKSNLQPPLSLSPSKLSRKVASLGSSMNSSIDGWDNTSQGGNSHEARKSDRTFPENDGTKGDISEHSSSSDSSRHNISLPGKVHHSHKKALNLKLHQDKFNTTMPHCASPSDCRSMPGFPMSPQKEFLQGARECQGLDSALPPQVRNSLDMSVSSYYSDSPSSSPSSSCDPIYQVFVPYTGWASYYAGGAIWVLYNDGTQLGVKATEAVMTFVDQDGTHKRFKNSDVVPEIVKMKLEKLPNVLKAVMKNKNEGMTS